MSNQLAIATVSGALRQIVLNAVSGAVSGSVAIHFGRPPATASPPLLVNIYLYRVVPNGALRNDDLPTRDGSGRPSRRPRAAIDLHYLISFYGDAATLEPERMLASVVRDLHARPVVGSQLIADAVAGSGGVLAATDLATADEPVRFSLEMLSLDDLARLWSLMVQSPHAVSIGYLAQPVILDALEQGTTALPVLRRGADDQGVDTATGPFPTLDAAWIGVAAALARTPRPASLRAGRFGTVLLLTGSNLGGETLTLTFRHRLLPQVDLLVAADARSPAQASVTVDAPPLTAAQWAAGLYEVTATTASGGATLTSPVFAWLLAPQITAIAHAAAGSATTVSITCTPPVLPDQPATLRIGLREVPATARAAATDTLDFVFDPAPVAAAELVWLRVDGAESMPFVFDAPSGTFAFDPAQRITLP